LVELIDPADVPSDAELQQIGDGNGHFSARYKSKLGFDVAFQWKKYFWRRCFLDPVTVCSL